MLCTSFGWTFRTRYLSVLKPDWRRCFEKPLIMQFCEHKKRLWSSGVQRPLNARGQRGSWMPSKIFSIHLGKFLTTFFYSSTKIFPIRLLISLNYLSKFFTFSHQLSNFTKIRSLDGPQCCIMPRQRHFSLLLLIFTYISLFIYFLLTLNICWYLPTLVFKCHQLLSWASDAASI